MELDDQLSQLLENMTLKGAWNVVADMVSHRSESQTDEPSLNSVRLRQQNDKLVPLSQSRTPNAFDGVSFNDMDCGSVMQQESYTLDGLDMEQARCPSPLFFSATLLTFDDVVLDTNPKGKPKTALVKVHRKRGSSLRLRAPAVHPKPDLLGPVFHYRRRLSGNRLHSPRLVPGVPTGPPRVHHRVQRSGQGA